MKPSYLRLGGFILIFGAVAACSGDGCGCIRTNDSPHAETTSEALKKNPVQPVEEALEPPPAPINVYEEEPISVEVEFQRYERDIRACNDKGKDCAREEKAGRKMARRVLRELQKGNNSRLLSLWEIATNKLEKESSGKLRLEFTKVLKIAFAGASSFKERLIELLENESDETAANNIGELLLGALSAEDEEIMARLEHYLLRIKDGDKGLIGGQIGVWKSMEELFKTDTRWFGIALTCLEKTKNGRLKTVLTQVMSHARPEHRLQTLKVLGKLLKGSRSAEQLSLASASVETLGKLGQANALDDIEFAIKTRFHQRSFLPSAALALFHLAGRGTPGLDGKRVVTSAERILEIPGLSLVAYRYALYAIRDSGHSSASATLKSYAKHSNKEARKIAVKALLGVGK